MLLTALRHTQITGGRFQTFIDAWHPAAITGIISTGPPPPASSDSFCPSNITSSIGHTKASPPPKLPYSLPLFSAS